MRSGRRAFLLMPLAGAMFLASCGDQAADTADTLATPPSVPLEIGELVWTSDVDPATGAPIDTLTSLPSATDRIVAALQVPSLPAGVTLQARWEIDGNHLVKLDPEPVASTEPLEDAWVSWSLSWGADEPWPIGTLGIRVLIDGEEVTTARIFIVRGRP
jgi:hypothetical protein